MKYMLDTNICIYLIKEQYKSVINKFNTLKLGDIGLSSVTLSELMYGVEKSHHRQKNLQEFIISLDIAAYDDEAAAHYGVIRAHLEKKGIPIGPLDLMIAAHARSQEVTLVTNNKKEFSRVPGLQVEDWVHRH